MPPLYTTKSIQMGQFLCQLPLGELWLFFVSIFYMLSYRTIWLWNWCIIHLAPYQLYKEAKYQNLKDTANLHFSYLHITLLYLFVRIRRCFQNWISNFCGWFSSCPINPNLLSILTYYGKNRLQFVTLELKAKSLNHEKYAAKSFYENR